MERSVISKAGITFGAETAGEGDNTIVGKLFQVRIRTLPSNGFLPTNADDGRCLASSRFDHTQALTRALMYVHGAGSNGIVVKKGKFVSRALQTLLWLLDGKLRHVLLAT